uniref:Putative secreted protein n=1 Tax=Panstrongylus lignarius TaxID=156445 RepID=A0A224XVM2_9HEMI
MWVLILVDFQIFVIFSYSVLFRHYNKQRGNLNNTNYFCLKPEKLWVPTIYFYKCKYLYFLNANISFLSKKYGNIPHPHPKNEARKRCKK